MFRKLLRKIDQLERQKASKIEMSKKLEEEISAIDAELKKCNDLKKRYERLENDANTLFDEESK